MRRVLQAIALPLILGCNADKATVSLQIDHYQVPCLAVDLQLCLLVREDTRADWNRFFDPINGFTPTWGVTTTAFVERTERYTSGVDNLIIYDLIYVQEEQTVEPGTSFNYPYRPSESQGSSPAVTIDAADSLLGRLMDGREFQCSDTETCNALNLGAESRDTINLTLEYADPISGPLLLTRVDIISEN